MAAVNTLKHVTTLILGGYDRGIDYQELVDFLEKSSIENLLFLGEAGNTIMQLFKSGCTTQKLLKVRNIETAVRFALDETQDGICLLSPAAASYDQFHNFEHRGDTYKQFIKLYGNKKSG